MEVSRKFLHDRVVLTLVTLVAILLVIGVSTVFLRFDVSKNPTTIVAWRPNITGSSYQSGKPLDIYALAVFMLFTAVASVFLSARTYTVRRPVAIFLLASAVFLLLLAIRVSWSLISLQ